MNTSELVEQARAQRRESMRTSREGMIELLRLQAETIDDLKEEVVHWKGQATHWREVAKTYMNELYALLPEQELTTEPP